MEKVFHKHLAHVAERFLSAFQRALPGLPLVELVWRLHFVFGAVAHTMSAAKVLRFVSKGMCDTSDVEGTLSRMEAFLMAGLSAPVPAEVEHAAH
jgi:hypothetical protein